jgi:hypothetical protein
MKINNYKNTVKGLRKLSSTEESAKARKKNLYLHLQDTELEEDNDNESSNKLTVQNSREKKGVNFDNLPEDMLYIILDFLPYNTRVAILKNKYSKYYIKSKLEKITKTVKGINQIWKCAEIAGGLLENLLECQSGIFNNFSIYSVQGFKKENRKELYTMYYGENLTKIILAAIHHYSKIYKFGHYTNKKVIEYIEKVVLKIFAHLSVM